MDHPSQRIVISGPPGSGKSTLIEALRAAGCTCRDEVSRSLIREQRLIGGKLAPWEDLTGFAMECFRRMRAALKATVGSEPCFFDRGVPDLIGYLRRHGHPVPKSFFDACREYTPLVFMAPPWREIYVNDPERPQSFAEAVALSEELTRAYVECGFSVIELPRASAKERVKLVLGGTSSRSQDSGVRSQEKEKVTER